jgi:hypothetical protein
VKYKNEVRKQRLAAKVNLCANVCHFYLIFTGCCSCTSPRLIPLQDFTVLSTAKFRRCVIRSLSVIFLLMSSPTEYVRRLYLRRWFLIPSVYQSEKQKNHLPTVLQTERARQKKRFLLEIYRRIFIPSVKLKLPTENIRRYIGRWNWKYRRNMSVCKFVGTGGSYC